MCQGLYEAYQFFFKNQKNHQILTKIASKNGDTQTNTESEHKKTTVATALAQRPTNSNFSLRRKKIVIIRVHQL